MPDEPVLPIAEELALLPHGELAERLAEAYRVIVQLTGQARELTARVEEAIADNGRLARRIEALERQAGRDSGTSSRPPSSDSPFRKKPPRDRSLREKGKRAPGRQPGEPGSTMKPADNPEHRYWYPPAECAGCGTGLEGEEVFASRRHQVTGVLPAPEPEVTGHAAQSKRGRAAGRSPRGSCRTGSGPAPRSARRRMRGQRT